METMTLSEALQLWRAHIRCMAEELQLHDAYVLNDSNLTEGLMLDLHEALCIIEEAIACDRKRNDSCT